MQSNQRQLLDKPFLVQGAVVVHYYTPPGTNQGKGKGGGEGVCVLVCAEVCAEFTACGGGEMVKLVSVLYTCTAVPPAVACASHGAMSSREWAENHQENEKGQGISW